MVLRSKATRRVVGIAAVALIVAAVAGPVQARPASPAAPASVLIASPTSSPIALSAGGSVPVTVTNTDRRTSSSALTVTLVKNPASAPFVVESDSCVGSILAPGGSCTVVVKHLGSPPTIDQTAALTVASGKPLKASVTRVIEVGVTFADVCVARGGLPGQGGTIDFLGQSISVVNRCDWNSTLATTPYNAAFEALADECRDLAKATVGYPVTGEAGKTAIGCVAD